MNIEQAIYFATKMTTYSGHEWRIKNPPNKGFVCIECNKEIKNHREMSENSGCCKPRFAPKTWLPFEQHIRELEMEINGSFHLLHYVFAYLKENHPEVMQDMLEKMPSTKWNDKAGMTLKESLHERYKALEK